MAREDPDGDRTSPMAKRSGGLRLIKKGRMVLLAAARLRWIAPAAAPVAAGFAGDSDAAEYKVRPQPGCFENSAERLSRDFDAQERRKCEPQPFSNPSWRAESFPLCRFERLRRASTTDNSCACRSFGLQGKRPGG